ncbi:VCBS domain-containing protein, partial [Marinobacter sp.]
MLSVDGGNIIDGTSTQGTLNWTFNSGSESFSYLAAGESLVLTYTVRATDSGSAPASDDQTVTITINGTNDDPVISTGAGDSNAEALTETNDPLQVAGTLSVEDLDTTNEVLAAVQSVSATGDQSTLTNADLLAMMSVDATPVIASGSEQGTINWAFDSNGEAFNHLAENEVLTLTFTLSATDTNGSDALQAVTLTITGTQDAPIIVSNALPVDFSVSDAETIEPIDASVAFTDSDNGTVLTYSADNLPAGLNMDTSTGVITGTLDGSASQDGDAGTPGVYTVTLAATDADGNRGETTVMLNVSNPAPETVDLSGSVTEDRSTSTRGNLLAANANDEAQSDPDGDALRIHSVQGTLLNGTPQAIQGQFGTLFVTETGDWRYQLDNQNPDVQRLEQNQTATDRFIFVVDDSQGGQTEASLDIRIDGQAEAVIRSAPAPQAGPDATPFAPNRSAAPGGEGNALPSRTAFSTIGSSIGFDQSVSDLFNSGLGAEPVQLAVNLRDVVARESVEEFALPASAFVTSDGGEVEIEATLPDGSALPGYVSFDADSGSFRVNRADAIADGVEQVDIKVIGRDEAGNEASASFVIYLLPEQEEEAQQRSDNQDGQAPTEQPNPEQAGVGAPALGDMVKSAGQTGFDREMSGVLADLMALMDDTTNA